MRYQELRAQLGLTESEAANGREVILGVGRQLTVSQAAASTKPLNAVEHASRTPTALVSDCQQARKKDTTDTA
jgi:chorismate-pyruvate lyase